MLLGYTLPAATEEMLCGGKRWDSQKERLRKTNRSSGFCHAVRWKPQWQIVCPSPCSVFWLFKAIQLWLINYNLPWVLFCFFFLSPLQDVIWVEVWERAIKFWLASADMCVLWGKSADGCIVVVTDRTVSQAGIQELFNYSLLESRLVLCFVLHNSKCNHMQPIKIVMSRYWFIGQGLISWDKLKYFHIFPPFRLTSV